MSVVECGDPTRKIHARLLVYREALIELALGEHAQHLDKLADVRIGPDFLVDLQHPRCVLRVGLWPLHVRQRLTRSVARILLARDKFRTRNSHTGKNTGLVPI